MLRFKNKVALITGGAGSIGTAAARLLLSQGAQVMLVDTEQPVLERVVQELASPQVAFCVANVSQAAQVQSYVAATVARFGAIDLFLNNAGIMGAVQPIEAYPEDAFDRIMAVNVKGVWLGCKHVLPHMNDGGSIIITSSLSGLYGTPSFSGYVTSKHAVVGIMRTVALEAAPRRIRVNTIHPGPIYNSLMEALEEGVAPGDGALVRQQLEAAIPLGRYAQAEEAAQLAAFLGSDESQYITGTTQVLAGGRYS
ncbi:MAG TPA: SDR family NAD(P)-dependent oxidoreductase [Hymenobacter sp.]|jgi:NAD(P)-dependent dehydrogenase (short-subunit alcohol dehydrogenase family)